MCHKCLYPVHSPPHVFLHPRTRHTCDSLTSLPGVIDQVLGPLNSPKVNIPQRWSPDLGRCQVKVETRFKTRLGQGLVEHVKWVLGVNLSGGP